MFLPTGLVIQISKSEYYLHLTTILPKLGNTSTNIKLDIFYYIPLMLSLHILFYIF